MLRCLHAPLLLAFLYNSEQIVDPLECWGWILKKNSLIYILQRRGNWSKLCSIFLASALLEGTLKNRFLLPSSSPTPFLFHTGWHPAWSCAKTNKLYCIDNQVELGFVVVVVFCHFGGHFLVLHFLVVIHFFCVRFDFFTFWVDLS